jgi:nitrogen regulatory protein P-II 1
MKEIKAYVHSNRIADVIAALKASSVWNAGGNSDHNLTVYMVKGSLVPLDDAEKRYSVELGEEVVNEHKLELLCSDEYAEELVEIISRVARTGQATAGWVYVVDIAQAIRVGS